MESRVPEATGAQQEVHLARASICLLPVSPASSNPTGGEGNQHIVEWRPFQGFVYPSVILPKNVSSGMTNQENMPSSPFVIIPNTANRRRENEVSTQSLRRESYISTSRPPSSRKTSFGDSEGETITKPLSSHQEEEQEETEIITSPLTSHQEDENEETEGNK